MPFAPDFDEFRRLAESHDLVPVYTCLFSDTLTPVTAYRRIARDGWAFLFESVVGGERVGRYSFVGTDPFLTIEAFGNRVVVTGDKTEEFQADDPLKELETRLSQFRAPHMPDLPRFTGGAVGYAGYDVVRYAEHLPDAPQDDRGLPDLSFAFCDQMVVFDHIRKTTLVIVHAHIDRQADLRAIYDEACRTVDSLCDRLRTPDDLLPVEIAPSQAPPRRPPSNFTQAEFEQSVERCREYIRAGDIFQVVISQRMELETTATPLDIYRALRVVNPSPFMFLLSTPGCTLVGSSPEIMVRVEDRRVTVRPLAGTRRRGATDAEDKALEAELLADEKERAEHVMLVDLARNDVGRVAEYGSIDLSDVMQVERYSHVMHITSNVTGTLVDGGTALDALRAGLPAGTVSGAPKVRAMQIIDEIEPHRRGPYAGAVGYIDFTGNMDTCIALRTLVIRGNTVHVQAGAGIVADSRPEMEYEETLNKAAGILKAIELAEQSVSRS